MNIASYMNVATNSSSRGGSAYRMPEINLCNQTKSAEKNSVKNKLREMAYSPAKSKAHQGHSESSIYDQAKAYSEQLTQIRTSKTDTANQVKQLNYKFKDISTQIRQSKNSTGAKKVVLAARREVLRLKRLRATGEYDEDELTSAITHAQTMERVAKKKARHLQEEEMVKIAENASNSGVLEEDKESENEGVEEASKDKTQIDEQAYNKYADSEYASDEAYSDGIATDELMYEEMVDMSDSDFQSELTSMLIDNQNLLNSDLTELSEEMEEMLKDSSLGELLEDAAPIVPQEMSEDEFKVLKQNHRNKEEKMLVKADAEFLKDTFERYQAQSVNLTV